MPSAMLLVFIGECIRRQFGAHGTVKMKSTQEHIGFPWIIGGIQHGGKYFLVSVEFVPQSVRICNLKELRERNAAKVYPGCEIISMHMDYTKAAIELLEHVERSLISSITNHSAKHMKITNYLTELRQMLCCHFRKNLPFVIFDIHL